MSRLVAALVASAVAASPIPAEYAENVTVYHVNPLSEGVIPINMDTADARGDIFFDFRGKIVPIECAENPTSNDCQNAEVTADDLVITKLVLEVDNRYGAYGRCNICVNGSSGASRVDNCTDGEYVCTCSNGWHSGPCPAAVGKEDLTKHKHGGTCKSTSPEWQCWRSNMGKKAGGFWYSTVAAGYCGDGTSPAPAGCTWRVTELSKVVNKTCSDNAVYAGLEARDEKQCFSSCGDSGLGPARNTSSSCWIKCFYDIVLGAEGGRANGTIAGLEIEEIVTLWEHAFESDEEAAGGCPNIAPTARPLLVI